MTIDHVLQLRNWMTQHAKCKHPVSKKLFILCDHFAALEENKDK